MLSDGDGIRGTRPEPQALHLLLAHAVRGRVSSTPLIQPSPHRSRLHPFQGRTGCPLMPLWLTPLIWPRFGVSLAPHSIPICEHRVGLPDPARPDSPRRERVRKTVRIGEPPSWKEANRVRRRWTGGVFSWLRRGGGRALRGGGWGDWGVGWAVSVGGGDPGPGRDAAEPGRTGRDDALRASGVSARAWNGSRTLAPAHSCRSSNACTTARPA
jgi:hypothetical protein